MVLLKGADVELLGQMAVLPPDISPLQIGTRGQSDGKGFTLIGRVRLAWEDGAWTEWFLQFDDGTHGWLAEAQGFYMLSVEAPVENPPAHDDLAAGHGIEVGGKEFIVRDVKETVCLGSEGELPFPAPPGRKSTSVDLGWEDRAFGCIEYHEDGVRFYSGEYRRFDELTLTHLRPVPGWFGNPPLHHETGADALGCPECGAAVSLRTPGQTVSIVCESCGALLNVSNPKVKLITGAHEKLKLTPIIPLGRRGTLMGTEYETVGFMQRADGPYTWEEYLLFHPYQGYAWLTTFQGHWNFVTQLLSTPPETDNEAIHDDNRYKLFLRGEAVVRYVLGEFYWRVTIGERAITTDFIRPPFILSREGYPSLSEVTWSHGQYLEPSVVFDAFGADGSKAERSGTYMNQPNPVANPGKLWLVACALLGALILIQLLTAAKKTPHQIFAGTFTHRASDKEHVAVIPEFDLKARSQALFISSSAEIDNSWLELGFELVNVKSGEKRRFIQGLEHYSGSEDGEYWSEGKRQKSGVAPAVPAGKYKLLVSSIADPAIPEVRYNLRLESDRVIWSNFLLCASLLLLYPGFQLVRKASFEERRWAESDYTTSGDLKDE